MCMKVNGRIIRPRERDSIVIMMGRGILGNGLMIYNKDMGLSTGLMELNTKETTKTGKKKAMAYSNGRTVPSTEATSPTTTSTDKVSINGPITESTRANGRTTRCMDKEHLPGKTEESTWVTM